MKKILILFLFPGKLCQAQVKPACTSKEDFNYQTDICSPSAVTFQSSATVYLSITWTFDDGTIVTNTAQPSHLFTGTGNHMVSMVTDKGTCSDTVNKTIVTDVVPADIILTPDTTICAGSKALLRSRPSLGFCWYPATYLDNPSAPNPVSTTPVNMTYYYRAERTGVNLIVNGDFSAGNTGFTSEYSYANPNITEGQYFVGSSPNAWNASLSNCPGHTTGNDNMLLVNGAPVPDVNVWKQTVAVTPNTDYAFATWVQALWPPNPAQLKFSINGHQAGVLINASLPTCTWTQFYTKWNSGNNTTAVISIVNINTAVIGNDFALDDISFAPVFIQSDSVVIKVQKPIVKTNNDTMVCTGKPVQLQATGNVSSYNWSPATGLSNPAIAGPVASAPVTTAYIVTGITSNGCIAKDTVLISVNPGPVITKTGDAVICHDKTLQLNVAGGSSYAWLPAPSLSSLTIANPVAAPVVSTVYYVTVTDNSQCSQSDSIRITVTPPPVFSISPDMGDCSGTPVQLNAGGGNNYSWQPAAGLSDANTARPVASPAATTLYTVKIKATACNDSATLSTRVTVLPLPMVQASSSNEIDCQHPTSQLAAAGGVSWLWQPATGLNDSSIARPLVSPSQTTLYTVKGTDMNGCSGYDTVNVQVTHTGDLQVNLPNAFSPNSDGKNDCFGLSRYAGLLQQLDFSVYDRFGVRIFHTSNPLNCWDGRYKGTMQPAGGFVYIVKASTFCGSIFKKGVVMLLK